MNPLLLSCTLLSSLLLLSAVAAEKPAAAQPAEITLAGLGAFKPIGVEPVGGKFQSLLAAGAKRGESAEAKFSTTSRRQEKSTLAIFASDSETMHDEKPLARVEISGLKAGEQKDRIRLKLTVVSPRKLSVEAWDTPSGRPLAVRQLSSDEVLQTKYAPASGKPAPIAAHDSRKPAPIAARDSRQPAPIASLDSRKPAPIASRDTHSSAIGLAQSIGVRAAGGLMQPILPAGAPAGTTKAYYLRPRFPDQTTADITLFAGDSPYMENNKLWERYLISGLPAGPNRRIKLDFTVGPDGKPMPPKATEVVSKQELKIEKYSASAAARLEEPARTNQPAPVRHIPAAPAGA